MSAEPLTREERDRMIRWAESVMSSKVVSEPVVEIAAWDVRRYEATVQAAEAEVETVTEMAHAYQYERDEAIKRAEALRAALEMYLIPGDPSAPISVSMATIAHVALAADEAKRGAS